MYNPEKRKSDDRATFHNHSVSIDAVDEGVAHGSEVLF